jgi:Flp pilus assembly secretin CpaC
MATRTLRHAAVLAAVVVAIFPAVASAQAPDRSYYGPYSVYGPGLTYVQRSAVSPLSTTLLRAQTTVSVPDRGTALVAGSSSFREGRNEFSTPVLGKVPLAGRPLRSTGYGYSLQGSRVTVSVRIIDLAAEDARILQGR